MAKPVPATEEELERELRVTMSSGIGAVVELGDRLDIHTHSGGHFEGAVEDCNLSGIVIRTPEDRLFFVSMSGIEYAEIFEADDDDGARDEVEDAEVEDVPAAPAAPAVDAPTDITPITKTAAA